MEFKELPDWQIGSLVRIHICQFTAERKSLPHFGIYLGATLGVDDIIFYEIWYDGMEQTFNDNYWNIEKI